MPRQGFFLRTPARHRVITKLHHMAIKSTPGGVLPSVFQFQGNVTACALATLLGVTFKDQVDAGRADAPSTTSGQLLELLNALPEMVQRRGLKLGPEVLLGEASIIFAPAVTVDDVLDTALAIGASMVFPGLDRFDPADEELDEAERESIFMRGGQPGDLRRVRIHWIAQGVHFVWTADATLFVEAEREALSSWDAAEAKATREADEELRVLECGRRDIDVRVDRVQSRIVNNTRFKASGKRQRVLLAETIAGPRPHDQADMFARVRAIEDAVEHSKGECTRWEREISSRLPEVVDGFIVSPLWNPYDSLAANRRAAAEFLMDYADGWRLSNSLSDRLVEEAASASAESPDITA